MQVNAVQSELNSLHRAYNNCLMSRVDEWMGQEADQKMTSFKSGTNEFCVSEKKNYFNFMERNAPTEYKNIMRLEMGNY